MDIFFSFLLICCLTGSPDSKQKHCSAPCLFRAGCGYVTIRQVKTAGDGRFALGTASLFRFTILITQKEMVTWFHISLFALPQRCLRPHLPLQQPDVFLSVGARSEAHMENTPVFFLLPFAASAPAPLYCISPPRCSQAVLLLCNPWILPH